MKNPFEYGGVVGGPAFCKGRKELAGLLRAILAEGGVDLYAPSLILVTI